MKFGWVIPQDAEGAILAHSVRLQEKSLKKGRLLTLDDVQAIQKSGQEQVMVARLEEGDLNENEAALLMAKAVQGNGVRLGDPFTGRCNMFSTHSGLLVVDEQRLMQLNFVDEALTVATLKPYSLVAGKQMIATAKVIPFAVAESNILQFETVAKADRAVIHIASLQSHAVGLIQTRSSGIRESVLDKTTRVVSQRLELLGSHLLAERRCQHTESEVAQSISELLDQGAEMIFIAGASAIVDRRDVIPSAIIMSGGEIEHYGMPVDPGNLLLLAQRNRTMVIGLPGCARSPKPSGFDFVLQRLLAGIKVTAKDIMSMGAGGLLKEIAERPTPRLLSEQAKQKAKAGVPKVNAMVLAAGRSFRQGTNHFLEVNEGRTVISRLVEQLNRSKVESITVVTGYQRERIESALAQYSVGFVYNPNYDGGFSTTLVRGLEFLDDEVDAVLVCHAEMPELSGEQIDRLIDAFDPIEGRSICVPTYHGKRGNPVLWSKQFFAEMQELKGDVGARHLIGEYHDQVCELELSDE
ncbi:NTP transferase domain-containing protein [Pseudomonadota bacterium]